MLSNFRKIYNDRSVPTKIAIVYGGVFMLIITLINFVMLNMIYYTLLSPAEATIRYSSDSVQKILEDSRGIWNEKFFYRLNEKIVAGVVFRVYVGNKTIFDSNPKNYPSDELFEEDIINDRPLMASREMDMAEMQNALVYREELIVPHNAQNYRLCFYRTITSRKNTLDTLENFMLAVEIITVLLTIIVSIMISRKLFRPIREMTALAKKITLDSERDSVKDRVQVSTVKDEITELTEAFNLMLDRMQREITSQKIFVSDVSHELKTPLAVIKSYVKVLERFGRENSELHDESVSVIREEAQNMQKLLEHLRALTRADEALRADKEVFDLAEVVAVAFQRAKNTANQHGMILAENVSAQVYGDRALILEMLRSFIDNAIKYTPAGGAIRIQSIRRGDKIFVSVADNGIGIAAENFGKIFERGVRLTDDSFVGGVGGSGIGLAKAKEIADIHGITIDVESTRDEGTTFTLQIPVMSR